MYRIVALVEARAAGRAPVTRGERSLVAALLCGIRQIERTGARVVCVGDGEAHANPVVVAADLVLRLREVSAALSEEDLLALLELLPL